MYLPISLAAAAAAAFTNLWLSIRIGMVRSATKISVGDGGNDELVRRMRAQANFIENTPIVLILIAAIELSRPANHWLAGIAALYTVARIAHGVGMDGGPFRFGRMIGTMVTMATLLGLAVWAATIAIDM
jgi:uncharacterized membrane protein YecN with MAPEG domain